MPFSINNQASETQWSNDFEASVDVYNQWFLNSVPKAFDEARQKIVNRVEELFEATDYMRNLTPQLIIEKPSLLPALRQSTAPPIARDRLAGLANVPRTLVLTIDRDHRIPPRRDPQLLNVEPQRICDIIIRLLDPELFPWLATGLEPTTAAIDKATVVIGDRYAQSFADPAIRNDQEARQLEILREYLDDKGYVEQRLAAQIDIRDMPPGTYAAHQNVPVIDANTGQRTNMPIDLVVAPHKKLADDMPILIEAKSAGDETNTNKRRKEEAQKLAQLRATYGEDEQLVLFLTGYFGLNYLKYEAAEGIDWVWCHRVEDLDNAGI
ncbi:XamI family restriction endonuclease [Corynebacterium diphtheriae]|nr:XamI family restriction endonuclease [Corynebacterium diphtheriae]